MSDAEVIAWLRSDEGEEWSRERNRQPTSAGLAPWRSLDQANWAEDPCGRPPLDPAATETAG